MEQAGIRDLKQNASAVVGRAAAGDSVVITDRGRPVALLTPIPAGAMSRLEAAGRLRRATRSLAELSEPDAGSSVSAVLAAMRTEERS